MKIAHLVCSFPPYYGGMGNSAMQMALAVAKFNYQVAVITPDYGSNRRQSLDAFPDLSSLKLIRPKPWFSHGNAACIPQITFSLLRYDIVHWHYPFYGVAISVLLAKLLKPRLKIILHYHMDTSASGWKGLIFKLYRLITFPLIFKLCDFVSCASIDYLKHSQISRYALSHSHKFGQISFGVDLKRFHPTQSASATKQLLFVGGLDDAHYFKGVGILLTALSLLPSTAPNWTLNIIGRGNLKSKYQDLTNTLDLSDRVNFIDDADDDQLVEYYQSARCLILPSINSSEAFGLVLLEAMACGKPVIASNLPGVRNVFKNKVQGLLSKPNSPHNLAHQIITLLQDDQLVDQMGQSARQLCEREYSWSYAGKKLSDLYHRIKFSPKIKPNDNHSK